MRRKDPGHLWPPVIALGVLLALWYGIKTVWSIHDLILPSPHQVVQALWTERAILWRATLTTGLGAALGFGLAVVVGFFLAIALAASRTLHRGLYPLILFMQMTPILATAAIVVILFDVGLPSVMTIAFLIGFFPVVANSLQGLLAVSPAQRELFHLYKASPTQEMIHLRIPHALPYFFTGARIAATLAVIGAVTGEIFAGTSDGSGGLGFLILIFKAELKIAGIYAATLLCCLLGFIFVGLVAVFQRRALRSWHPLYRARD